MSAVIKATVTIAAPNASAVVTKCTVPECERPHKAKGYCLMHYRRCRRTGDPANANCGGKQMDAGERFMHQLVDGMFADWSPRTRARYVRAWRLAQFAGHDFITLVQKVARPNGSIPVERLLQWTEDLAAMHVARMELAQEIPS
jgi:hypothetical protein